MAGNVVVVFDFDKTIIDSDSDQWVVDELGFTHLFNHLLHSMPWNSLMDRMMGEIHAKGKTVEDMKEVLRRTPIHPRVVPTIKSAYALGCELRIVSDANYFFIETILEHHGIKNCFTEINTNPCYVDENGRLKILPYHDFHSSSPHSCELCPSNMCKGSIIERIRSCVANEGNKRFIYVGDGKNDYCPTLKLKQGDYMMPRKNYPVWDLITKNHMLVKAEIHGWIDGQDFENVLLQLIERIYAASAKDGNKTNSTVLVSSSVDCKSHTIPLSSHDTTFPQPLPVPN